MTRRAAGVARSEPPQASSAECEPPTATPRRTPARLSDATSCGVVGDGDEVGGALARSPARPARTPERGPSPSTSSDPTYAAATATRSTADPSRPLGYDSAAWATSGGQAAYEHEAEREHERRAGAGVVPLGHEPGEAGREQQHAEPAPGTPPRRRPVPRRSPATRRRPGRRGQPSTTPASEPPGLSRTSTSVPTPQANPHASHRERCDHQRLIVPPAMCHQGQHRSAASG